jgi:ATP-dependent exoDNAse (exonuclease V) beta subunit
LKSIILKNLECFKDPNFKFDPKYHKYTYNGFPMESVTRFIHHFHMPFNQEYWSKAKADEAGVPQEWILKDWKAKNDYANEIGSATHQWIENYFNKKWQPLPENPDIIHRINKFNKIYSSHLFKLEPIAFEVKIFSKKWKLAGTIDSLFLYRGKIFIIDYKTNGDFTHDSHPKGKYERLLQPLGEYWKNHHNEYSIQISLYAAILQEWGFEIAGGYLLHIGPGDEDAKLYPCINMVPVLEKYLNEIFVS